jgi:hypothetical protein
VNGFPFHSLDWEKSNPNKLTCSSSFRIWSSFVEWSSSIDHDWCFGKINYFIQFKLKDDTLLQLAHVDIFVSQPKHAITSIPMIDTRKVHEKKKYVMVQHLNAPVMFVHMHNVVMNPDHATDDAKHMKFVLLATADSAV